MSDVVTIDKTVLQGGIIKKLDCPGALEVFELVCSFSENDKFAKVSIEALLEATGYTLYRLYQCLNKLEETGYIKKVRKGAGGKPQIYELRGLE